MSLVPLSKSAVFCSYSGLDNEIFLSAEQDSAEQVGIFLSMCLSVHSHVFLLIVHFFINLLMFISPDNLSMKYVLQYMVMQW